MESVKKNIIFLMIGFFTIALIYILFSQEEQVNIRENTYGQKDDENQLKGKTKKKRDLSFLLSGKKRTTNNSVEGDLENETSLFESDFFKAGNARYEEDSSNEENDFIPQGDIPIDPNTGKPYSAEVMTEFDLIRKDLPNNDLIPKRLTPEEKEFEDRKKAELATVAQSVRNGNATRDQIILHYDNVEKKALDRLELIEYIMENDDPDREIEGGLKIRDILDNIRQQLEEVRKEKEEAFAVAGI